MIGNAERFYERGLIDEVRIFNRALTPCEIANIANRTCGADAMPPGASTSNVIPISSNQKP